MAVRFLWELCTGITQALAAMMHWVKYDEKAGKRMEVVVLGNALERMCIMGTVMERQWTTCNNLQQVGAFSPRWIHQSRCTAMWCMAQGVAMLSSLGKPVKRL